jgi:hypothetical protein
MVHRCGLAAPLRQQRYDGWQRMCPATVVFLRRGRQASTVLRKDAPMRPLALACALACFTIPALAGDTPSRLFPTPKQPVHLAAQNGSMHVLCAQVDEDFDGQQDDADANAHWLSLGTSSASRTLPWGTSVSRPAWSPDGERLYIFHGDTLVSYDVQTGSHATVDALGGVGITVFPSGIAAAVSMRPSFTDPGTVRLVSLPDGTAIRTFDVGVNPGFMASTVIDDTLHLAVICEGSFGSPNSALHIAHLATDGSILYRIDTVSLGDTGNDIALDQATAWIAVNGSHTVLAIDVRTGTVLRSLPTGTTEFDGPRRAIPVQYRGQPAVAVGTFTADVRLLHPESGATLGLLDVGAKPEYLLALGDSLYVTRTFVKGGYAVDSGIAVFSLTNAVSSVQESSSSASVWPTPASTVVTIAGMRAETVAVINATGQRIDVPRLSSGEDAARISVAHLPAGLYLAMDGARTVPFVIAR